MFHNITVLQYYSIVDLINEELVCPQTSEQYEYIQCRIYHSEKKNLFVFILSESYMLTTDFSILVAKSSQKNEK